MNIAEAAPKTIYLNDYQVPPFLIDKTFLQVDIFDGYSIVTSHLQMRANPTATKTSESLNLHGADLELLSISVDGKVLLAADYSFGEESLSVHQVPKKFELSCVTKIYPEKNTSLEGLYRSRTIYCTQCEAEGFRKITYYLDRPDVMSEFTTRITADKKHQVLLSNGNLIESGELEGNRHFVVWQDPFKKPAYLFALVAGSLSHIEDSFTTASGRKVQLKIFVEEKDLDKCDHAMRSLKNSMRWDEEVYGREYDLDIFMIVAVDDFNMGAMENKGLNIFNTSCVLADSKTTTDMGFQRVESVVAHEYFHNWSGNRVTCRDWFQLSLKEGFTVFRDSEFSADMGSRVVKRIEDVGIMRTLQFAEDAGPMAHPIRPSSYIEISNFYTMTVYEKGAEVIRMLHTLLGAEKFRAGSDLYFSRYDGQAVTTEDFVAAMAEASGRDLTQFKRWYDQAGTPELIVTGIYREDEQEYELIFKQSCPPTPECKNKQAFHIPVAMGLLGAAGDLPLKLKNAEPDFETGDNTHMVLEITQAEQRFVFERVMEKPVPSLLRNFSAPVKLKFNYSRDDLLQIMSRDSDGFCRWDAGQNLAVQEIQALKAAYLNQQDLNTVKIDHQFVTAMGELLANESLDKTMVAFMLTLPSEAYLSELSQQVDVEAIYYARKALKNYLAIHLEKDFAKAFEKLSKQEHADFISSDAMANRALKNVVLSYLVATEKDQWIEQAFKAFNAANNMTDSMAALSSLVNSESKLAQDYAAKALQDFYQRWQHEALVVNQWFTVQATCVLSDGLSRVKSLENHPAYDAKNPNKIRALISSFCNANPINFHHSSGDGYLFLADKVLELNQKNPQIASRLLTPLTKWKRYDAQRQALMKAQLERIAKHEDLSKDVFEVVSKSLV